MEVSLYSWFYNWLFCELRHLPRSLRTSIILVYWLMHPLDISWKNNYHLRNNTWYKVWWYPCFGSKVSSFQQSLWNKWWRGGPLGLLGGMSKFELKALVQYNLVIIYLAGCKAFGGKTVPTVTTIKIVLRNMGSELSKIFWRTDCLTLSNS